MNFFVVSIIFTLFLGCHAKLRILEGTEADEGSFPYQASLQLEGDHFCGASILNKRYLLTAAHCVAIDNENATAGEDYEDRKVLWDPKYLNVAVGSVDLESNDSTRYDVEKLYKHEEYGKSFETGTYDIALIRVSRDIEFNDRVQPVKLASSRDDIPEDGGLIIISGWGSIEFFVDEPVKRLRYARTRLYDLERCIVDWKPLATFTKVDHTFLCVKGDERQYKGDSGGPAVNGRGVQVGIVSGGIGLRPDLLTNVLHYADWISERIGLSE